MSDEQFTPSHLDTPAEDEEEIASEEQRASHPSLHWQQGRMTQPWKKVLAVMAAILGIWLVLDASTLKHNAETSPVGLRRDVALTLLRPIAATASALQISQIESAANRALGRSSDGSTLKSNLISVGPTKKPKKKSATPSGVTTTTLDPLTHASAANPVRILLIGDSLGLDLGGSLQNALASTGVVTATLDGKESTGLTRPDYYNWPAELQSDLGKVQPQVVVVMMGANDPQDYPGPPDIPFGNATWTAEYERRCVSFMQLATSQGAKLVWVSLPSMQDPGLNAKIATINTLQKQAASQVPGVIYLDSSSVLASPTGGYSAFTTVGGKVVNVRTPDGIHITPQGGDLLAQDVMASLRSKLGIPLP